MIFYRSIPLIGLVFMLTVQVMHAQDHIIWQLGETNASSSEFALSPNDYQQFLANDFGYEDRCFLVGQSIAAKDAPYVLPGPANGWGGTGPTSGLRTHFFNLYYVLDIQANDGGWSFEIAIVNSDPLHPPVLQVAINGRPVNYELANGVGSGNPGGASNERGNRKIVVDHPRDLAKEGFNQITLTVVKGGWVEFDSFKLLGPDQVSLVSDYGSIVKRVAPSSVEVATDKGRFQNLLVEILRLKDNEQVKVLLDHQAIFDEKLDQGLSVLEIPMPSVRKNKKSKYEIFINDKLVASSYVKRSAKKLGRVTDYVNTMMGVAHSRWMLAPGPWMPFSMVKLSPDNQNPGWQAGYEPSIASIGTFSHIHEWTMSGLGTFPTAGKLITQVGDQYDYKGGYRSLIDKATEKAPVGSYYVHLLDHDIEAELTATARAGFQRYTYNKSDTGRVMIDLKVNAEYQYKLQDLSLTKVSDYKIVGHSNQFSENVWSTDANQDYIIYFVLEFDQPIINYGVWHNERVTPRTNLSADSAQAAGMYVEFDVRKKKTVQLRTGLSYVSSENAEENLREEISRPFGWSFDNIVENQHVVWDDLLGRIEIQSNDYLEKEKFYTNMYRSLASRNTFSDINGEWRSADEKIRKFQNRGDLALGCDAFWNTFWNLNQFWNLVTPEWSSKWVRSQLAMYDANGWLAKGPAGMEYIPVMVAEHEIPLIVGAYQMGIRDYDVEKAFEATKKMQTTPPSKFEGGYAGNRDLDVYLKHKYVPYDLGRFSNSLEYSFDDWTVGQFAKSLRKKEDFTYFNDRGSWWKNVIDVESGYARMKDSKGQWVADFDPFKSGANHHYVEGNAWQLTFFVPQDIPSLAKMIGEDIFLKRLEWGFEESEKWRFNGPNDQYWDYPVVQGNQQSMHFAFIFNWLNKPWLTQRWSRSISERYYGQGISNAYLGDEDQGQMSAWYVMSSIGLFQLDGGTRSNPIYEIGSPMFREIKINLNGSYGRGDQFVIKANNTSKKNIYVQSAMLNGKKLDAFFFDASELLKGGELILEMGPEPNTGWGVVN
ncbi:GH92 family glycosyl hydrolase [Parapedobacter pyrenivorans]|uniref:GH92 family glycosyl hydrolase n=1 Tax=Parapedobacter pyrenivorans TaxID=1305674 RepID=UPI003340AE63